MKNIKQVKDKFRIEPQPAYYGGKIQTIHSFVEDIQVGDCQLNFYDDYLGIFSITTYPGHEGKDYAELLYYEVEEIARQNGYNYILGEWSQEKDVSEELRQRIVGLAKKCGFRVATSEDYSKINYHGTKDRINYFKEI